ncbi:MAG: hypothetical protein VX589_21040 [Myxococcota bacterium]|nr:hypothetical protein [Myxococcota bacterium]
MTPLPIPPMDDVCDTLGMLFNREVKHRETASIEIGPSCGAVVTLLDEARRVRYVWAFDWQLAHILAGALQMASPQRVKAAVKAVETPSELVEHITEVVNVCRASMNAEGRKHIQLGQVAVHGDGQFSEPFWTTLLDHLAGAPSRRIDVALRIVGYGTGRMSIVSLGTPVR